MVLIHYYSPVHLNSLAISVLFSDEKWPYMVVEKAVVMNDLRLNSKNLVRGVNSLVTEKNNIICKNSQVNMIQLGCVG